MENSMSWSLTENVNTSAGRVSAGSTGKGRALVLAHGWPWSSYSWHRIIPALSQKYHVFWYDMPGYGESEMHADQRSDLGVQGTVFGEMLEYWKLVNPIVFAHDMGGATTLRAHLLGGIDFDQYILMNVVAMRPWGSEFFDHVGKHVNAFTGLPPHIHKAVVESYIQGALVHPIDTDDFQRLAAPWLSEQGKSSFYRQFEQADEKYTAEVEESFSSIRCPVKIIWGEEDPWIPLSRGESLRDLVGPAEFKVLPGVGHLPQIEAPAQVLSEALDFLAG